MSAVVGILILLLIIATVGFLGYWFFLRLNTIRGIDFGDDTASVKTRIVTRLADDIPQPLNENDFKIRQIYITPSSGLDANRSVMILGKSINHTIDVENDKISLEILVKPEVCKNIEDDEICGDDIKYNGMDYKFFVQKENISLSEFEIIKENKKKYYEFEIYINDDNTMYIVIEEST